MTTLTGTYGALGVQPKYVEKGMFAVVMTYDNGLGKAAAATISAGDTIIMGKLANGVTILDGYFIQTEGDTGSVSIGIDSETNFRASASTSSSEKIAFTTFPSLPMMISLSDDTVVRYRTVKIGVDADYTTTTQFKIVLYCQADGQN